MSRQGHWDEVYGNKPADTVSWYQPTPGPSLQALERFAVAPGSAFIDVGGGASALAEALLARGWSDLTVLDIAEPALAVARERLGPDADRVSWLVADMTRWTPPRAFDVWHDRAVFHFLTAPADRDAYKEALRAGLRPGGLALIATFAPDGPERCSGLPVQRYDAAALAAELGPGFELLEGWREDHTTPGGAVQKFSWAALRRLP
jgi:SAM-dependent methyltransferase